MSFIAGHYAATWNGNNIGTTMDGFRLQTTNHAEIFSTDDFGDSPVEGIQRGVEYRLTLDYAEYDLIEPALVAQAGTYGKANLQVGTRISDYAKELVLTAVSGTPAYETENCIRTLTAPLALIVTDFETIMAARLRRGPVTFLLMPEYKATDATRGDAFTLTHYTPPPPP